MYSPNFDKVRYSPTYRSQIVFGQDSASQKEGSQTDRPYSAVNYNQNAKNASNNIQPSASYAFQPYTAPYVDGKKTSNYVNPSMASNQVFYDHNYSYKGDLPNNRLLSPVKNDRYSPRSANPAPSQTNQIPMTAPQGQGRRQDYNEEQYAGAPSANFRKNEINDYSQRNSRSLERVPEDKWNKQADSQYEPFQPQPQRRKGSNEYQRKIEENYATENRKPNAVDKDKRNESYVIKDDRSDASTVISTLSSTNYVCPKCLNRHIANDNVHRCMRERENDAEKERRIAEYYKMKQEEEEAKRRIDRMNNVNEGRRMKDKLDQEYNRKREERRSPAREETTILNKVFQKQDEMRNTQKELGQLFRAQLKDQLRSKEHEKQQEKIINGLPYGTSLQVGTGYSNKYLDSPEKVISVLQEQVEEKAYKQKREKEMDQRTAQQTHEQAIRSLKEEEQKKKEKEWKERLQLQDAFQQSAEEKRTKQREELISKMTERKINDINYAEYKRRQQEEEARIKRKLLEFNQDALHPAHLSYRDQYEQKRTQHELTSFDPVRKTPKKVYPCGECNTPFEKIYLTKLE